MYEWLRRRKGPVLQGLAWLVILGAAGVVACVHYHPLSGPDVPVLDEHTQFFDVGPRVREANKRQGLPLPRQTSPVPESERPADPDLEPEPGEAPASKADRPAR